MRDGERCTKYCNRQQHDPDKPVILVSPYLSWAVCVSWGSSGTQLTHNLLENIDGGGLVVQDGPNDPANNNINMSYNLLENGCGVHGDDLGCLYMYDAAGQSNGGLISYNTVYGYGAATQSIKCAYLDAVTLGATVKGNVCASNGAGTADLGTFALFIHGGKNNSITNNLFGKRYCARSYCRSCRYQESPRRFGTQPATHRYLEG